MQSPSPITFRCRCGGKFDDQELTVYMSSAPNLEEYRNACQYYQVPMLVMYGLLYMYVQVGDYFFLILPRFLNDGDE